MRWQTWVATGAFIRRVTSTIPVRTGSSVAYPRATMGTVTVPQRTKAQATGRTDFGAPPGKTTTCVTERHPGFGRGRQPLRDADRHARAHTYTALSWREP